MLITLSIVLLFCGTTLQQQCQREDSRTVHVAISSRRNQTGHWHTRLLWDHVAGPVELDDRELPPVMLNMSQRVRGCPTSETLSMEAVLVSPPARASPGYGLVPGVGRYKFHATPVNWDTARKTCSGEGGYLVVIRSKKQEDALKALFAKHPTIVKPTWNDVVWVGVHDQYTEGDFITVIGSSFSHIGYANWEAGQPNNKVYDGLPGDSDCLTMHRKGTLFVLPCSAIYAFICEQELW